MEQAASRADVPTSSVGLSDAWRQWVLDNLVNEAEPKKLLRELVAAGADIKVAARELELIASVALPLRVRAERLALALRLRRETLPSALDVRSLADLDDFYTRYYDSGVPLVIVDGARALVETGMWDAEWLAAHYGDIEVRVDRDRNARPKHYVDPEQRRERVRLRELLARFHDPQASNDIYMVSRNRTLEEELAPLRRQIRGMPAFLEDSVEQTSASLWMGPRGTVTPLHHDTCSVFFAQVHGRKRMRLVSPLEAELLLGPIHDTFYSDFDLDNPGDVTVFDITLEPGMGVFIPTGWWHHVVALSASISLSFTGFRCANGHDYYRPGAVGGLA